MFPAHFTVDNLEYVSNLGMSHWVLEVTGNSVFFALKGQLLLRTKLAIFSAYLFEASFQISVDSFDRKYGAGKERLP